MVEDVEIHLFAQDAIEITAVIVTHMAVHSGIYVMIANMNGKQTFIAEKSSITINVNTSSSFLGVGGTR